MGPDIILRLWDDELAVVVEKTAERFEHIRRSEVQLVQHDLVTLTQSAHQKSFSKTISR